MKKWQSTPTTAEVTALEYAFNVGTVVSLSPEAHFFDSIYIPVKKPTESGMPESYTWENIGLSFEEIGKIYNDLYGENFIVERLTPAGAYEYLNSIAALGRRIKSVLEINKQKYLGLIELNGYTYNPLYNVDAEEIYSSLENQGVTDETVATGENRVTFSSVDTQTQTQKNTYEGTLKDAETVTTTADPDTDADGNPQNNYTRTRAEPEDNTTERTYTHHNADNNGSDYTVSAADNAFNQAITGGDKYHTDKRIRRGNIGVTASQDLIEKSRITVRFSILQEFFDDINKQILVGIFDF